jgi:hypothetical protein
MARAPFDPLTPALRQRKPIPFDFVIERLARLEPHTRPMFGCTAVYVEDRIVLVLRERGDADDGVWVVYAPASEAEVLALLPRLRNIDVFREKVRGWKKLAATSDDFEDDVERVCVLLLARDARFGKIPASRRVAGGKKKATKTKKSARKNSRTKSSAR